MKSKNSTVLVIGDTHCPALHPRYIKFLKDAYSGYSCNRVVHIGDLVDWNAISYHEKDPSMPSAGDEFKKALKQVRKLHAAFPEVDYMLGNHCSLPERKARTAGLTEGVLKPFGELWELDGWTIHPRFAKLYIDGVQYRHGDSGKGGQDAALKNAQSEFCSVVQGHHHTQAGVKWHSNDNNLVFGMQTGCGVSPTHPAMNYGRIYANRPILGCGVVFNGKHAIFEPMPMK